MTKASLTKSFFESEESRQKTMIRFLFDVLKFRMIKSSIDFAFDTLSSKISSKSKIIIKFTNDVFCDILIDAIITRHEKFIKRDKTKDLILLIAKNEEDTHIHEKHDKLITRVEVLWKKNYDSFEKRSEVAKVLWNDHQRSRELAIEEYLLKITKWIKKRHIWEYALTLQLFELNYSEMKWSTVLIEKYLIEEDSIFNEFVMIHVMLMTTLNEKKDELMIELINENSIIISDVATQSHTSSSSTHQDLINTIDKKIIRFKRRKTNNIASLHEHLQRVIIFNFISMNEQIDRNDLNEKISRSC
jgi:hypothetical protein